MTSITVPDEIRASVVAAVSADPNHMASLLDLNPEAIRRGHDWMVYEQECKATEIMKAAGLIAWRKFWVDHPMGPIEQALLRVWAEMEMQEVPE